MENEMDRLKRLSNDSYETIKKLSLKKKEIKKLVRHEMDKFFRLEDKIKKLEREQPQSCLLSMVNGKEFTCEHSYSKEFDQPFPRLCTKCKEPEND